MLLVVGINIANNKKVEINGLGKGGSKVVIDGGGQNRLFNIGVDSTLVLNNVIIRNGNSTNGGAIFIGSGSILELNNSEFINNTASGNGGVIYGFSSVDDIQIYIDNSRFEFNNASNGGVIYSYSNYMSIVSVTNSSFKGNIANVDGGVVYSHGNMGSSVVLAVSMFSNNQANNFGGVIYSSGAISGVQSGTSTFINNVANKGGVIYNFGNGTLNSKTNINIIRSLFSNNTGHSAGGSVYNIGGDGVIKIQISNFTKNNAIGDGGAIFNNVSNNSFSITGSIFNYNKANQGSIIYNNGVSGIFNLTDSLIFNNFGSNIIFNQGTSNFIGDYNFWGTGNLIDITNLLSGVIINEYYIVNLTHNSVSKYGDKLIVNHELVTQNGKISDLNVLPSFDFDVYYNGQNVTGKLKNDPYLMVNNMGLNLLYSSFYGNVLSTNNFIINVKGVISSIVINNKEANYNKDTVIVAQLKNSDGFLASNVYVNLYLGNKKIGQGVTDSNGIVKIPYKFKTFGNNKIQIKTVKNNYYLANNSKIKSIFVPKSVLVVKHKVSSKKIKNSKKNKNLRQITLKTVVKNKGPKKTNFIIYYKIPKKFVYASPKITGKKNIKKIKVKFNKKSRTIKVKIFNLKNKKKISVIWKLKSKKGNYAINLVVKKNKLTKLIHTNSLRKFKVK